MESSSWNLNGIRRRDVVIEINDDLNWDLKFHTIVMLFSEKLKEI